MIQCKQLLTCADACRILMRSPCMSLTDCSRIFSGSSAFDTASGGDAMHQSGRPTSRRAFLSLRVSQTMHACNLGDV